MLEYMNNILTSAGIDYQFGTWATNPVPDPYFVGEYTDAESVTFEEDGYQETAFIITGTGSTWRGLETARSVIERTILANGRAILPNGDGIALFYAGAHNVPTGDTTLKRIEVYITVKKWKVI